MALTADDYTRLGTAAADDLASKNTPLVESVDRLAETNEMNLEQIKRLCEAANNAAFKALFDKSDPSDREVRFDVAKAEDVIARRRKNGEKGEKVASMDDGFDAALELRPLAGAGDSLEKVAQDAFVDPVEATYLEKKAALDTRLFAEEVVRVRSYLEEECAALSYKLASAYDDLATYFRNFGPDDGPEALRAFEKNAAAVHGDACAYSLRCVRNRLTFGDLPDEPLAKFAMHVRTPEPEVLGVKLASALEMVETRRRATILLETPGALEEAIRADRAAAP